MKLLCFPYAGAHVNVFSDMSKMIEAINPTIRVIAYDYAGHGRRFSEKPHNTIQDNAADLYRSLQGTLDKEEPLILLGYSMGSIVAYEIAKRLVHDGYAVSKLIFMAATPPHRLEVGREQYETDDELIEHCLVYGLIKAEQFSSEQMRKLFLPALRSDILAVNHYNRINRFECHSFDPAIDIAVFQGQHDLSVSDVDRWKDVSSSEVSYYSYPAGHFFLYEYQQAVIDDIISFINDAEETENTIRGGCGQ
jgi:Predicted thioesterase involved in non-ribosomal peptide biosynthesis